MNAPSLAPGWTDERVSQLRRHVGSGMSASQIAAQLGGGLTRNAVIGKVMRLGLVLGGSPNRVAPSTPKPATVKAPSPKSTPKPSKPEPRPAVVEAAPEPAEPAAAPKQRLRVVQTEGRLLRLAELGARQCRYPTDDPGRGNMERTLFCAADCGDDLYCPAHMKLCFNSVATAKARATAGANVRGIAGSGIAWGKRGGALAE